MVFVLAVDPNPPVPGAELERLTTETRKMLAAVARKCKRQGIEGYDATDEWLIDLDEVVRKFYGLTHQDVVTMVEAIQNVRWNQFPEASFAIWSGVDVRQCTQLLEYLHREHGIGAVQRISRKTGATQGRTLTVYVEEYQFNAAQAAKVAWLERRKI
jgi:hypothetical protein